MAAVGQDTTCAFPGCVRPRVPAPVGGGRPSAYCDDSAHTAVSAFRARRAAAADAVAATGEGEESGGRPASLAGMRLRSVADQVREELASHRQRLDSLVEAALESLDGAGDPAAVEAELASMRAELIRSLVDTDAALAGERRDRAAAEERAVRAEQLRGEADADAAAARQDATSARTDADAARADAAEARREAEEHRAAAAAASAAEQAVSTARVQAEEQADRARAAQAGAERDAEAAREQADRRTADALAQAHQAADRAEAAARVVAAATAEAADVRRRAEVAEQRAGDADLLRSRADERVEDYRAQLEENRRREADRAQEHRDRVAELGARIDDLTHAHQRET